MFLEAQSGWRLSSRKGRKAPKGIAVGRLGFDSRMPIPLMTHEGSGMGGSERDIKNICKGAVFGKGLAVHGADAARSEKIIAEWAKNEI